MSVFMIVVLSLANTANAQTAEAPLGRCKMCILVLKTISSGFPFSMPTICQNNLAMEKKEKDFEYCQEVVAVLSQYGPSVALWQSQGCFRTEEYGAVEQMIPCPAHVICSQMETLQAFVVMSDVGTDPTYDHNKLRAQSIPPKTASNKDINTFCPPPLPQYVTTHLAACKHDVFVESLLPSCVIDARRRCELPLNVRCVCISAVSYTHLTLPTIYSV